MTSFISTNRLRQLFLDYFHGHGHEIVPGSSLVPSDKEATLLFTNAGMVPFKEVFLGNEVRPYSRATSAQRCLRAGGKHNDLENVGYTRRHHTFFEMLGNFSFGDYFKREAIQFSWYFLTKVLKLSPEKLWITVFHDDQESEAIWLDEIKINPKRFSRCGEKDNFWSMGDTGPCGPSSEIFYDHGSQIEGGPPGSVDAEGDRYVEIWNLVFMQFNRDIEGHLRPLPKLCVDTGMGLERIAAVMQGVYDNYEIDLFQQLLQALSVLVDCRDFKNKSMRVIVDHIRSASFMIIDGITPSNEGRGYVLRRIIRRALRHGFKLGQKSPFFYQLVPVLAKAMGDAYPQIRKAQHFIKQTIHAEEEQFSHTLVKAMEIFDSIDHSLFVGREVPGSVVFQLYDTHGLPIDLTAEMARVRGFTIDYAGFQAAMDNQRQQSQRASQFHANYAGQLPISGKTDFIGHDTLAATAKITHLLSADKPAAQLVEGEKGTVVLDRTPFYAESGGQVGDTGYLYTEHSHFHVLDTQRQAEVVLHYGMLEKGRITIGDVVNTKVDPSRHAIMINHSATHLLHEALRRILGHQVTQKGSLVSAKYLRFDFSYPKALTAEQIERIECMVNQQIRSNIATEKQEMPLEKAKELGAMALFDEKYGSQVRVIRMGDFSTEICGGTHLESTGEIGLFKIISETAVAAGIRRIEAVTANEALQWILEGEQQITALSKVLKSKRSEVVEKVEQIIDESHRLNKEVAYLKQQLVEQQSQLLIDEVQDINGIKVLAVQLLYANHSTLRQTLDYLKSQFVSYAVVLAAVQNSRVQLVAGVSKDCMTYFNAIELLNMVASSVDGKGGGRPDLAQGGGNSLKKLGSALEQVSGWVEQKLAK